MDLSINPPTEGEAGKEFDQWFDWSGATNPQNSVLADTKPTQKHLLPISPLSATQNDFDVSRLSPHPLTAQPKHDLPTPDHSSSSPEAPSFTDLRLSGETLRDVRATMPRPLKRKLSPNDMAPRIEDLTPAAKKRPHNIIEKRYRANLNEKIAELRDSVPSLRSINKTKEKDGSGADSDDEDLSGLAPSNKLNKASVLTKAVEYIKHLEFRNKRLEDENRSLKDRLETLDKVIAQGGHDSQRASAFTSQTLFEEDAVANPPSAENSEEISQPPAQPIQGLISMPEAWRRLRQNQPQEHYGHVYDSPRRSIFKGKWPSRIMVGSLAGLMVLEGFSESDQGTASREKGLFGIPLELLDGWKFLRSPRLYLATFAHFCQTGGAIPLVKGFMALTILAFVIFAYLFNSKPPPKEDVEGDTLCADQTAAPASPISVRRRAWSVSMQALNLPHHSFFPEWLAVTVEWLKYSVRYLCGYQAYFWLTGRSVEDDAARIKAWDIAIDAQLAGGDVEVSRSRVVLTSFGSGTLPASPLRLMQKALHSRLLLWDIGQPNNPLYHLLVVLAKFVAKLEWQKAKRLHDCVSPRDADRLPANLAAMLAMECEDVFTETVVQRAYNLMYDRPTQDQSEDCLLDVVVEDHAIRSPLDAVAAWRSTTALRKAFETSLQCPNELELLQENLELALRIAPTGSAAEVRALAGHALFGRGQRKAYYNHAINMMSSRSSLRSEDAVAGPYFIDSSTPESARADIDNCLHCANALIALDSESSVERGYAVYLSRSLESTNSTILTHAALKHVQYRLPELPRYTSQSSGAAGTIDEVGNSHSHIVRSRSADSFWSETTSMSMNVTPIRSHNQQLQQSPTSIAARDWKREKRRRQSCVSDDTGYESMDELDLHVRDAMLGKTSLDV